MTAHRPSQSRAERLAVALALRELADRFEAGEVFAQSFEITREVYCPEAIGVSIPPQHSGVIRLDLTFAPMPAAARTEPRR